MREINSRDDLEAIRGTPGFEAALLRIYGGMTIWSLDDGQWVAQEDLSAIERLGFTRQQFLDEIAPFDFPEPVAPDLPQSGIPDPLTVPLTKRQVTRALIIGASLDDPDAFIETAITSITDPAERSLARSDWRHAPYYLRDHPLFSNPELLAAAGMSAAQVDALWAIGVEQPQ